MQIQRPKSKQPIPENARKVFEGKIFDVYQWEQEIYDGTKKTFEKVQRLDTVVVFPVLPDGKIFLLEEKQPGCEPFWATVAGKVERGEDVLEAAKRELLEESGYEAGRLELWKAEQLIRKVDWAIYVFIAKDLKKVSEMNLDGGEQIEPKTASLDELIDMVTTRYQTFDEPELIPDFFEAKLNPKKKKELETLFDPKS
ncbi:MAG: NUDIX hydrolase [Patescibacteria group bacterium]